MDNLQSADRPYAGSIAPRRTARLDEQRTIFSSGLAEREVQKAATLSRSGGRTLARPGSPQDDPPAARLDLDAVTARRRAIRRRQLDSKATQVIVEDMGALIHEVQRLTSVLVRISSLHPSDDMDVCPDIAMKAVSPDQGGAFDE